MARARIAANVNFAVSACRIYCQSHALSAAMRELAGGKTMSAPRRVFDVPYWDALTERHNFDVKANREFQKSSHSCSNGCLSVATDQVREMK
jgi:hypothetical protein